MIIFVRTPIGFKTKIVPFGGLDYVMSNLVEGETLIDYFVQPEDRDSGWEEKSWWQADPDMYMEEYRSKCSKLASSKYDKLVALEVGKGQ